MTDTSKDTLTFTTRVLGQIATQRLRNRKVMQTIRSHKSSYPFLQKRGSTIRIALDGEYLYNARITEIQRKNLSELSQWDAEIGGFDTVDDFKSAVKRAGFRFKELSSYEAFRIEFQPLKEREIMKLWKGEWLEVSGVDEYRYAVTDGRHPYDGSIAKIGWHDAVLVGEITEEELTVLKKLMPEVLEDLRGK